MGRDALYGSDDAVNGSTRTDVVVMKENEGGQSCCDVIFLVASAPRGFAAHARWNLHRELLQQRAKDKKHHHGRKHRR